jgi:hypothetical protein
MDHLIGACPGVPVTFGARAAAALRVLCLFQAAASATVLPTRGTTAGVAQLRLRACLLRAGRVSASRGCSFRRASADESTPDALRSEIGNVVHGYGRQLSSPGTAVVHRGMDEAFEFIIAFVH